MYKGGFGYYFSEVQKIQEVGKERLFREDSNIREGRPGGGVGELLRGSLKTQNFGFV